jgi:hypothetical protein
MCACVLYECLLQMAVQVQLPTLTVGNTDIAVAGSLLAVITKPLMLTVGNKDIAMPKPGTSIVVDMPLQPDIATVEDVAKNVKVILSDTFNHIDNHKNNGVDLVKMIETAIQELEEQRKRVLPVNVPCTIINNSQS